MALNKKQLKLQTIDKGNRNEDFFNTLKKDAYSMPSKFYATMVYYPATERETQTFLVTVEATAYLGTEKIGELFKTDEFDTAREGRKWVKQMYKEFLRIIG